MFSAINVTYLFITILFGVYGYFYADFAPKELTIIWAKYLSIIFFVYFVTVSVVFFIKNKHKTISVFKTKVTFYSYIVIGLPLIFAFLAYVHFGALSKGIPALYTGFIAEKITTETKITNKRLWGKRDRREEVSIKGFVTGFPVSRNYYDSVSIGQTVTIIVLESELGTKIEFIKP
ncbi:MAG: hypothetical protein ACJAS1_006662 [Oleiphilaceae bacterium]|jgi:hypothetical protein